MILVGCESLIDFVPVRSDSGMDAYRPVVGGGNLNIAVAAGRLGVPVAFIGGVSSDPFGEMIVEHLRESNVDVARVTRSARQTTLAFVKYIDKQARYMFYDEASAGRMWRFDSKAVPLAGVDLLHIGSTTLINEPVSGETKRMAEALRAKATIAIDPNCRPAMTPDPAAYRKRIAELMALSDIIRVSVEDLDYLRPGSTAEAAAADWLKGGAAVVIVTDGGAGATAYTKSSRMHRPALKVEVVDTIGAGDTFHAAFLVNLYEAKVIPREKLRALTEKEIGPALEFAAQAAAITCSRPGADPPWRREMPV
ncbi:MAG TPA: carbohydrate kinase [Magnetospirillaceae bacterium]|jgi:fructokinase